MNSAVVVVGCMYSFLLLQYTTMLPVLSRKRPFIELVEYQVLASTYGPANAATIICNGPRPSDIRVDAHKLAFRHLRVYLESTSRKDIAACLFV